MLPFQIPSKFRALFMVVLVLHGFSSEMPAEWTLVDHSGKVVLHLLARGAHGEAALLQADLAVAVDVRRREHILQVILSYIKSVNG